MLVQYRNHSMDVMACAWLKMIFSHLGITTFSCLFLTSRAGGGAQEFIDSSTLIISFIVGTPRNQLPASADVWNLAKNATVLWRQGIALMQARAAAPGLRICTRSPANQKVNWTCPTVLVRRERRGKANAFLLPHLSSVGSEPRR